MQTELVRTTTADGVRLNGALNHAASSHAKVDAVICLHGVASPFYGSSLFESLVPHLLDIGVSVLRVNTRGHDSVFPAATGRRLGAAYERVHECTLDIDAWWDNLQIRGFNRIGLLGHSLGAIKGVFHQTQQASSKAACLVALSPPRLSHLAFSNGPASPTYNANLSEARKRIEAGDGSALMEATFPFPLLITADGYLDKYGPGERYNIVKLVGDIKCQTLFTYGQRELEGAAFAGVPESLTQSAGEANIRVETIDNADHLYSGVHDDLAARVVSWLSQ